MGDVLKMADEKQAYTITDRATYLSMVDTLELEIVCEKDADMLNPYGVITVNPEKNDQINEEGAKAFADWLVSENGQKMIGEFGVEEFGSPLFTPDAK
jgi:tungstate transport system substrate-binding protein